MSNYSDLCQNLLVCEYIYLFDADSSIPAAEMQQYQGLINVHGSAVDEEVCKWLLSVLEKSTFPSLLQQVKQTYDGLPVAQCIGLILFKLIIDHIDLVYFGSVQGMVSFFWL